MAGIFFTFSLAVTLFALSIYRISSFDQAKQVYAPLLSALVKDMPDEAYQRIIQMGQAQPEQNLDIPGYFFKVDIKGKDVLGLTKDQLQDLLLTKTVEVLYEKGTQAIKSQEAAGQVMQGPPPGQIPSDLGASIMTLLPYFFFIFGIVSRGTHTLMWIVLIFTLIPTVILGVLLVLFSFRFGKLVSVGIPLVLLSFPVALLTTPLKFAKMSPFFSGLQDAVFSTLWQISIIVLVTGFTLIFIGTVAGIIIRLLPKPAMEGEASPTS